MAFPRLTFDFWFRAALVAAIAAAYAPSLRHPPRADQWCYLTDMMNHHGVVDVVMSSYSYTRTRATLPGDSDLYRPILFTLLATEKAVLEGDGRAVQAVGIALHAWVCLLLLSLLARIESIGRATRESGGVSSSYLPYAVTAFFAFSPSILELVIWAHLHGYLLFLVFVLTATNRMLKYASNPPPAGWINSNLMSAYFFTAASAFTYELGQVFALLAGAFLAAITYPRRGLLPAVLVLAAFFSIVYFYQAANKRDLHIHRHQYKDIHIKEQIVAGALSQATVVHTTRFIIYTAIQPLCPSLLHTWMSGDRVNVGEMLWYDPILKRCGPIEAGFALVIGLVGGFGLVGGWKLLFRRDRVPLLIALLFMAAWGSYAATNILGRMNIRPGTSSLSSNSYYCYTALLFGAISWVALVQGVSRNWGPAGALAWKLLLVGLAALALYGGIRVRLVNGRLADQMKPMAAPLLAVHRFVQHHRHEPDFSLAIDYRTSDPVPGRYGKAVTDIVFSRWVSTKPKYRVAIRHRTVMVIGKNWD